jgi:Orsellinic acid/F9775 biosynthesis cluster protein D
MEQLNHIFIHYPEYRIIICKQCKSAIIPAHVKIHLSKNHSEFMPKIRNEIDQVAQNITGLAQTKDDIIYPPASSAPVPHLPV